MPAGTLYLVPAALGESAPETTHPPDVRHVVAGLRYFVVENAKSARAELRRLGLTRDLRDIDIRELPEASSSDVLAPLLAPVLEGKSVGLLSEAGCPGIADPGAALVGAAHQCGIRVVPLVGPSSVLLGLMASGLNGQAFSFHGYLPVREPQRSRRIVELERVSRREGRTQIFIETPYRNAKMLAALLAACRPETRLCVASGLTTSAETVRTCSVAEWRTSKTPRIDRIPTVFLLLA